MWLWWFSFATGILIPLMMLIFGRMLWKHCPAKINIYYGYRTPRALKNLDTWHFANTYFGKLWWKIGWIILFPSAISVSLTYNASENTISTVLLIALFIQSVFVIYSIVKTELALKKKFYS